MIGGRIVRRAGRASHRQDAGETQGRDGLATAEGALIADFGFRIEVGASLRSSQRHTCDLQSDFAFGLAGELTFRLVCDRLVHGCFR